MKWQNPDIRQNLSLSLSLSLFHTHTHISTCVRSLCLYTYPLLLIIILLLLLLSPTDQYSTHMLPPLFRVRDSPEMRELEGTMWNYFSVGMVSARQTGSSL